MTQTSHKARRVARIGLVMATLALPNAVRAQDGAALPFPLSDLVFAGAGTVMWMTPGLTDLNRGPPGCAPCARDDVPFFDRWAIAEPRETWDNLSTGVLLGLGAGIAWDLARHPGHDVAQAADVAVSSWLAVGSTVLLKAAIARNRPVLYTAEAFELEDPGESRRAWPSAHAAGAFALATSYLLVHRDDRLPPLLRIGAIAGAALVGGLRIAAAEHFPSDVVSGAAIGVGSALIVDAVRF